MANYPYGKDNVSETHVTITDREQREALSKYHCEPGFHWVRPFRKSDGTEIAGHCARDPSHRGKYETFESPTGFQETKRKLTKAEAERRRSEYAQMTRTSPEDYDISEFMYEED